MNELEIQEYDQTTEALANTDQAVTGDVYYTNRVVMDYLPDAAMPAVDRGFIATARALVAEETDLGIARAIPVDRLFDATDTGIALARADEEWPPTLREENIVDTSIQFNSITFREGDEEVGKIFVEDGKIKFEGDIEKSAILLFDQTRKLQSAYINKIYRVLGSYTDVANRDGLYLADEVISNIARPYPLLETSRILL